MCLLYKKRPKQIYMKQIQDTPSKKCTICAQLQVEKNMRNISQDLEQVYLQLSRKDKTFLVKRICVSCKRALENGKLPLFATPEHIRRNIPLSLVGTLSELEERLVSLQIAFAQIRQWGHKRSQMGLAGSIINVPVHMDIVQKALPQSIDDTMTIAIALKRRLEYKNAYQTGKIRVHIVMKALKQLCSRNLYKAENIRINREWYHILQTNNNNNIETNKNDIQSEANYSELES